MNYWKSIIVAIIGIIVIFVCISIFDVVLSIFSRRFYSNAAFIAIFGVGGVFAAFLSYSYAMGVSAVKNKVARWTILVTMIIVGALFFLLLAQMEGGEYEMAFKAFGVMVVATSLFLGWAKIEI